MTLKEVSVGQTVKVAKLDGEVQLREELWIWASQRALRSM